jgi:ribonuclease-3
VRLPPDKLESALNYQFHDKSILTEALTHRSASGSHNERLEFLGDSILNFTITESLYSEFPKATEGQLSRLRASLVKEQTLAEIARELNLGDYLLLGSGELKSGGFRRDSIIADALEAIFGSILLDSDALQAGKIINRLFAARLKDLSLDQNLKDAKTELQELLQKYKKPLPEYSVISVSGEPHDQDFQVACNIESYAISTRGAGKSRRKAEQAAAKQAIAEVTGKLKQ